MTPHFWVEWRSPKRLGIFLLALAVLVLFCAQLPARSFIPYRRGIPFPFWMIAGWVGGWFTILFLKVEDLNVSLPFDYTSRYRLIGCLLILGSLWMAGLLWAMYIAK